MVMITKHGRDRTHSRTGLPKRAVESNARRALECGVRHSETTGTLRRYCDSLYLKEKTANNIRLWGDCVYIFFDELLITVLNLPPKYRKRVQEIIKRKREATGHDDDAAGIDNLSGEKSELSDSQGEELGTRHDNG